MSKEEAFYKRSHPEDGVAVDISAEDFTADIAGSLYIGSGGVVVIQTQGGSELTYNNVPDGYTLAVQVKKVIKEGTSADNMILQFSE